MLRSLINPAVEKQSRESELKRPISQAVAMAVIRFTAIAIGLLEVILIGRYSGFIALAAIVCLYWLDKKFKLGVKRSLGKFWWVKAAPVVFVAFILCALVLTNNWLKIEYVNLTGVKGLTVHCVNFDGPQKQFCGSWTLWFRIMLIAGLPFCATLPLKILDWVMQMELQLPNVRNAPVQQLSVNGIDTPTLGKMRGVSQAKERIIEKTIEVEKGNIGVSKPDDDQVNL